MKTLSTLILALLLGLCAPAAPARNVGTHPGASETGGHSQPSALSSQPSAPSSQPSALSSQPSAPSSQPSALSSQLSALRSSQPSLADSLYRARDYTQALIYYRQAEKEGATSPALYFNLGNAAMQADRYGDAMVAYQRAAALDPANPRIRNNIAYLQQKVDDRNTAALGSRRGDLRHAEPSGLDALWASITAHHSAALWGWLGFACFLLLLAGTLCYILSPSVPVRKTGFFASLALLAATVLFGTFTAGARRHWQQRRECVVTAYTAQLLPRPDKDAKAEVPPLAAGTLLTLPESDTPAPDGWVYVRLNPTTAGWMPLADLTLL